MIDDIPIRFHELFIGSRPGKSNRWEIAPLIIGKSAGAIGTERTRNHVSIIVVIDDTTYSREHRPIRIAIGGISSKCIVHIPPTYGLYLDVLSIDTHRAGIAGGRFPYSGSGQVMLVIPNLVVSKVIGRLEQDTLRIAIAHAIATIAIDLQWRESIRGIVIVVNTVAGRKGQSIDNLEAEVHMTTNDIASTFLSIVQDDTQRIVLDGTIRVVIIISLCIQEFHARRIVESHPQRIGTTQLQATDTFPLTTGSIEVQCQVQPIGHLRLDVRLGGISFVRTLFNGTFLIHIVTGNIRLQTFRAFREDQLIVLHQAGTKNAIDVIHSRIRSIQIVGYIQFVHPIVIHQGLGIGLCIHLLGQSGCFRETNRCIEGDTTLSRHPTLGRNDYDPIRTTRTVNSGRRSILQNLHALNVFRIDAFQTGFTYHTVYHIKRFITLVNGIGTTDTNLDRATRNTVAHDIYPGYTSLQGIAHLGNRLCLESLAIHHRYRTRHIRLAYRTIPDDYHFVQRLCIFFQYNIQRTTVPCHILVLITYIRHLNDIARFHTVQCKLSVHIGYGTIRCSFHHNGSTDNRHSRNVFYHTGTWTILLYYPYFDQLFGCMYLHGSSHCR